MADDGWWSDVTHRDDELTLQRRPWTPPSELSVHDAPTVLDAVAVQDPIVLPDAAAPPDPVVRPDQPVQQATSVMPAAVDGSPPWSLFEPASAEQATPAPAPTPSPAPDDDEVPFWLLPPPPRPGMPPVPPAAPTSPDQGMRPDPFALRHSTPQQSAPQQSTPQPLVRQRVRPGQPATRRDRIRGTATLSATDRARELLERAVAAAGPLAERAGPLAERVRTAPPVMLVAAAAFGVGVLVVLGTLFSFGGDDPAAPGAKDRTTSSPAAAAAVAVDRTTITAEASSEQSADGDVSYGADNTLDGKLTTAWNSDGKGPGTTLTYTFDAPVDLRSVTLTNGYQKTSEVKGKKTDLYTANSRVRQVTVVTDAGSWTWSLQDTRTPQTLRKTFGPTKTLSLKVVSVYRGAKYRDTAISEVSFTAAG